jgi:hypothetical protein
MAQDSETLHFRNKLLDLLKKQVELQMLELRALGMLRRDVQLNHAELMKVLKEGLNVPSARTEKKGDTDDLHTQ